MSGSEGERQAGCHWCAPRGSATGERHDGPHWGSRKHAQGAGGGGNLYFGVGNEVGHGSDAKRKRGPAHERATSEQQASSDERAATTGGWGDGRSGKRAVVGRTTEQWLADEQAVVGLPIDRALVKQPSGGWCDGRSHAPMAPRKHSGIPFKEPARGEGINRAKRGKRGSHGTNRSEQPQSQPHSPPHSPPHGALATSRSHGTNRSEQAQRRSRKPHRDPPQQRYFCVPCEAYLPQSSFYPSSIKGTSRICRACSAKSSAARARARRAANPALFAILNRTRTRAIRAGIPFLGTESTIPPLLSFWNYSSAISHVPHTEARLTLVPVDPHAPFTIYNAVLLTAREIRTSTNPLPPEVLARAQHLQPYILNHAQPHAQPHSPPHTPSSSPSSPPSPSTPPSSPWPRSPSHSPFHSPLHTPPHSSPHT